MEKVILAYSGGLDTTYCALYLSKVMQLEVHAVTVNTGGFSEEELTALQQKAQQLGIASHKVIDVTEAYYNDCIRYLIYGNMLKNGTYPLSVSAERLVQAMSIAREALAAGVTYIAHGSTGAGNDQVRFDGVFQAMAPGIKILTPIRDQQLSREAEIAFLHEQGIDIDFAKAKYSINKGLWGTSVGGAETLTSHTYLPEEAWPTPLTESQPLELTITFSKGQPVGLEGAAFAHPTQLIQALQAIAQPYGIGRDIHVGDTIIGIKGRVGFEAAAPMILIKAHQLLEKHTLTKWQIYWKDQLSTWYANWLHEGQVLDPVMRHIEKFLEDSQQTVSGTVKVLLEPRHFTLLGIDSPHDLMSSRFGSYGEMNNGWSGEDVKGFTKIFGNQVAIFHQVNQTVHND
ncbi:argininosuccinate synthase [Taibaiella koreensis]|uniref:argininosuccinate synthase n=1 Tax=Taibaiella koreensis TaxID=1268548 RepID=UPI000E599EDD|nr:argininosuccinate synthase domain-containing protein [Taibaiella koreensis]